MKTYLEPKLTVTEIVDVIATSFGETPPLGGSDESWG